MNERSIIVIKKPRETPLPDIPIKFPEFDSKNDLLLHLIEDKNKLKVGLPLIPIVAPTIAKPVPKIIPVKPHQKNHESKTEINPKKDKKDKKLKKKKHEKLKEFSGSDDELTIGEETVVENKHKKHQNIPSKNNKKEFIPVAQTKGKTHKKVETESEELFSEDDDTSPGTNSEKSGITGKSRDESSSPESESESKTTEENDIYAGLTPEERLAREKEEYIWRFRILKKQYGTGASIPIPEYNEHSDLGLMKLSYERTLKELYLDDTVENYRTYLMCLWGLMEYVCVKIIGIDLRGFTLQQIRMRKKYDRLLMELGEKSYTSWFNKTPVELRLLGLVLFQAGIFYIGKIVKDEYGSDAAEFFAQFTGQPPTLPKNGNVNNSTNTNDDSNFVNHKPEQKSPGQQNGSPHNTNNNSQPDNGRKMKGPSVKPVFS